MLAGWRREEVAMGYDVVIGLDVGKSTHHAVALNAEGKRLVDREVANAEPALRSCSGRRRARGGCWSWSTSCIRSGHCR